MLGRLGVIPNLDLNLALMFTVELLQPLPVYPVFADLGIDQGRAPWVLCGVLSACGAGGENEQNGYDER